MVSSITRQGITWTFDRDVVAGLYMNGDPWAVGPFRVLAISPGPSTFNFPVIPNVPQFGIKAINGSMKNLQNRLSWPVTSPPQDGYLQGWNGYEVGHTTYDATLNVALQLPLQMDPGDSLISCETDTTIQGQWTSANLRTALLTVVAAPPGPNEFRPPYWYPLRPAQPYLWNDGMLGMLPRKAEFNIYGAQAAAMATKFQSLWLYAGSGEGHWRQCGKTHTDPYYRERNNAIGEALLALCSDIPDANKRPLAQAMIQMGLDRIWAVKNGQYCGSTHATGVKAPCVIAAYLLGHSDFLNLNAICRTDLAMPAYPGKVRNHRAVWGEDGQTFYVEQTSPGVYNFGEGGYGAGDVGKADWGNNHYLSDGEGDNSDWPDDTGSNSYRECCASSSWVSTYLAIVAMGAQEIWGWRPWFDYTYRYFNEAPGLGMSLQGCPGPVVTLMTAHQPHVGEGFRQIGLSSPTVPDLELDTVATTEAPWRLRLTGPPNQVLAGLLVRAETTAVRPKPSYYGAPTVGHVYLEESTYTAHAHFTTDDSGTFVVGMPAEGIAGAKYTLQAALLINGQAVVSNAIEVEVAEAET